MLDVDSGKGLRFIESSAFSLSVAFSPDGKTIATGGHSIQLWDVRTGNRLLTIKENIVGECSWESLGFNPEGSRLAGSWGCWVGSARITTVKVWTTGSGQSVFNFSESSRHGRRAFAFSPDGQTIALMRGEDLVIANANSGEIIHLLNEEQNELNAVAFSGDGRRLITASDQEVAVWDIENSQVLQRQKISDICQVTFNSIDQPRAISLSVVDTSTNSSYTAQYWDINSGQELYKLTGEAYAHKAVLSPDEQTLAISGIQKGSGLGVIWLWNVENDQFPVIKRQLFGHSSGVTHLALSSDGTQLVSVSYGDIILWDLNSGSNIQLFPGMLDVYNAVFSPNRNLLVLTGCVEGGTYDCGKSEIWLVDAGNRQILRTILWRGWTPYNLAFNPDGQSIAVVSRDAVSLINIEDGKTLFNIQTESNGDLAFSSDGTKLITSNYFEANVWDSQTGQLLTAIPSDVNGYYLSTHGGPRMALSSIAPTLGLLGCTGWDFETCIAGSISLWSYRDNDPRLLKAFPTEPGEAIAISPDGKVLAFGGDYLRLWDISTGQVLREIETSGIISLALSPVGSLLVSGSSNGTIRMWGIP